MDNIELFDGDCKQYITDTYFNTQFMQSGFSNETTGTSLAVN